MKENFFIRYKLQHVLIWVSVFCTWYFLRYQDYASTKLALIVTFIKVADLTLMIYICNLLLIPFLLYRKKYVLFALCFIVMVFVSSVVKLNIIGSITNADPFLYSLSGDFKARIYDNVIPHFFLVAAGALFKLIYDNSLLQQRMAEAAKEKAEAELNFLKSQVNPHFLFNSLNSVYFLIDKNNVEARSSLHKFSEMLRYQLYELNGKRIPIEKEISYLKDYVDLQKLRKDESYDISFKQNENVNGFSIEPLLLIPFVENAFKHISHLKDKANFVDITMDHLDSKLKFTVVNSCESNGGQDPGSGGIGLNNVKRRLELLYPDQYELIIKDQHDRYSIELTIHLS
jgi:sensor histidine kinase YesM